MNRRNALRFFQELTAWYCGTGTLTKANDMLAAPHEWLYQVLWDEMVLDGAGRPAGAISCQQIIDIVLLHLAMRKGFESPKKTG